MILKTDKEKRDAFFILDFCFIYGILSGYLENLTIWRIALLTVFILYGIRNSLFLNIFRNEVMYLSIVSAALLLTNVITCPNLDRKTLILNILELIYPLLIALLMVSSFLTIEPLCYFSKRLKIFNIWWIINIIVLTIQIKRYPLFIKKTWMIRNNYYEDLCAGLFGYNRVHVFTLFACLVLIMNLRLCRKIENHSKRLFFIVYTILSELTFLICGVYNDNSAVFAIMPGCILFLLACNSYFRGPSRISKRTLKWMFNILFFGGLLIGLLFINPALKNYIEEHVFKRIQKILFVNKYYVNGTNERLAIAQKALHAGWGWRNGMGIGVWRWDRSGLLGFSSYGMSSIGSIINQAGLWHFLIMLLLYVYILRKIEYKRQKQIGLFFLMFVFVLIMTVYTVILTSEPHMVMLVGIIVLIFVKDNTEERMPKIRILWHKKYRTSEL